MNLNAEQEKKIEELLSQMTLEEKIGQMNQESPSIVGGFDVSFGELIEMVEDGRIPREEFNRIMGEAKRDYHEDDIRKGLVGSIMGNDPEKANELQKIAVEESRLGIPLIIGFDVIHGLRSVYPIAIAEACSFDDELFEETAGVAAKESRAYGINWNFAPMIDVARDSRWGRVSEGPGEDSYLASRFARAKIKGLQNDHSSYDNYVAACTKHFVAYSACESGRDYNTTTMAISELHNVYLPPFKAAMEEGACSAMASFNDLNGVPCTANEYTLRKILKGEYDLQGFVVSDANAIRECVAHGIARDEADAGVKAVNAGLDMDMGTHIYKDTLAEAINKGLVTMDEIDDAVRRILRVKMWLGLFDDPYVSKEIIDEYKQNIPKEHVNICKKAAEESIVLLKNDNDILPLKKTRKISLVGQLADMEEEIIGAWAMGWERKDCVSIKKGMENLGINAEYYPCCGPETEFNKEEADKAIENGDVIVAVVGELVNMSGEASSKADIELPGKQGEMLKYLADSGKPVVVVLMNGRPLAIGKQESFLPCILESWHLGIQMGNAVAEILFGDINPSGKLSSSFSAYNGQEPIYYNHKSTGRPASKSKFTSKYLDAPADALFPFGYGLSYSKFEYSNMDIQENKDEIICSVNLKNTGKVKGTEIVQLYMQDITASLVRPVKELKNYTRVTLSEGETKTVTLSLNKKDMGFYNNEGIYVLEDGKFRIYVGTNSVDVLEKEIDIEF